MEKAKTAAKNITAFMPMGNVFGSLLVVALVVGAFFLGSLWTKVQILEKGVTYGAGQPTAPTAGGAAPTPQAAAETPKLTKDDHVRGEADARIAMIEYSDLECPFCKTFHPTAQQVVDDYKGQVKWVYRHYPLSFHANAQKEAEASECVAELGGQDAFWKFIDAIYERTTANGTGFALDKLGPLAAEIGVDQSAFQTCLDDDKYAKKVTDQMDLGTREGVEGTPGTILLDTKTGKTLMVPGAVPINQIKPMIDELLKG